MNANPKLYRQLKVWQKAMDLSVRVYHITAKFPCAETYGLTSQLRRSCVSIPSNIAEANGRRTKGDKLQFLYVARGSVNELDTQLELAARIGFLATDDFTRLESDTDEVVRMLQGLISSIAGRDR